MLRQLFSGMSSHSPYISIIVPVYKAQHCLSTLVDSILSQAFTDWELLLIDDGSPDSSGAICDYFAAQDSRIHSFHKKNQGISSTCNFGIFHANGLWFFFCDQVDKLPKESLSIFFNATLYNTDLIAASYIRYENGSFVPYCQKTEDKLIPVPQYLEEAANSNNGNSSARYEECYLWNKLLLASIVKDNNLTFREDLHYYQDVLFVFQYLTYCKKPIFCTDQPVYIYYKKGIGESSKITAQYYPTKSPGRFYAAIHIYNLVTESNLSQKASSSLKEQILESYYSLIYLILHSNKRSFKDILLFTRLVMRYFTMKEIVSTWISRHVRLKRRAKINAKVC